MFTETIFGCSPVSLKYMVAYAKMWKTRRFNASSCVDPAEGICVPFYSFGDSNTYGESPEGKGRYGRDERWPGRLQAALGPEYLVIEEGLNGRTTVWEDEVEQDKSGKKHLPMCLASHAPLDLVILMLGTNDLKTRFHVTPSDIALSAEQLVRLILTADNGRRPNKPRILMAAPTFVRRRTFLGEVFGDRYEDSLRLGLLFKAVAERQCIDFLDIAQVAEPSELDGLHFDRGGHKMVALAMEEKVRSIFGD